MKSTSRVFFKAALGLLVLVVIASCTAWPVAKRMRELSLQSPPGLVPITIYGAPIPLDPDDEDAERIGDLVYRGGVHLTSDDRRFGGFSGLIVSADGSQLIALSDRAFWLTADISYDEGSVTGAGGALFGPLLAPDGTPIAPPFNDAEGLTVETGDPFDPSTEGSVLVSFESRDRVSRYEVAQGLGTAQPAPVTMPAAIDKLVPNKGLEGIVRLADGRLLAIAERTLDEAGNALAWLVSDDGTSDPLTYRRDPPYQVTDLARGPGGAIYALERRFSTLAGPGMRIRRLDQTSIKPGGLIDAAVIGEMDASLSVDNMEGLSIIRGRNGETLFFVISDDNLNRLQRTLLLVFELKPEAG